MCSFIFLKSSQFNCLLISFEHVGYIKELTIFYNLILTRALKTTWFSLYQVVGCNSVQTTVYFVKLLSSKLQAEEYSNDN